jgi:predicted NBD/HSP70 family sugar kinase
MIDCRWGGRLGAETRLKISNQWYRQVLGYLYQRRTATRREIIQATSLNPACVSLTIRRLLDGGVIQRIGDLHSTGGRKREVLKLNSEAGYFVVVDLEGTRIRVGLANFLGDIRCRWEEPVNYRRRLEIRDVLHGIHSVLASLDPGERPRTLAVGVSYTGLAEASGGITAVNLGWKAFPLARRLEESLELPIFYGNDGACKILAERWLGVAQERDNCVYVMAGVGLGIGLYVNGLLLTGERRLAGEFGHITVDPAAPDRCNCGKKGCLEAIASSPNIVRQYLDRAGLGRGRAAAWPVTEVFARARENDLAALAVLDRVGRSLGLGLSHVVSLLNPGLIVLGGDFIAGQDLLIPRIRRELERHCLPKLLEGLDLKASSLGHDSGLKGAASLAFSQALLDDELLPRMTGPIQLQVRPLREEPAPLKKRKGTSHGKTGNPRRPKGR